MINNNFKKILKCLFTYTNTNINNLKLVGLNGTIIKEQETGYNFEFVPYLKNSLNTIINSDGISSNDKAGVCMGFGAGSKQVSLEDYNLETIINNLSYQSSSVETNEEGYTVITSAKNNTSTDIIVSEVGIFCRGQSRHSGMDFESQHPFMLTRNVLETPITIKPNEIKTFTITINF